MPKTLSSALTLSTIGLGSKAVVKLLTKKFDVRGLPILLDALKEPDLDLSWRKGKQRAVDGPPKRRRGVVTGGSILHVVARTTLNSTVCNHNSVVDDPFVSAARLRGGGGK